MRYLYTNKPDEACHEVKPGVFGRPVHRSQERQLRAAGWKVNPNDVQQAKESKEKPQAEEVSDELAQARALYEEATGKKAHHKASAETLIKKALAGKDDD